MHDSRDFKIPQGSEKGELPSPAISVPLEALQQTADFVYSLARQDEENDGTWYHRCQSSSIILEHVLKQIDSRVLLDFTWDFRKSTGRLIPNNVHYVVELDGVFLDSCPNMYFHQNRGIEHGLILTPQNTHDGLYERYRGAGVLIDRYQRDISEFTGEVRTRLATLKG